MAATVLDSWALLAFFKGESASSDVARLIEDAAAAAKPLLMSVINWTEVYYTIARAGGHATAEQVASQIATLPVDVIGVGADLRLARLAAQFKAAHRLSLADAYAAALARDKQATLVTGDMEFKPLEGEISIQWLA